MAAARWLALALLACVAAGGAAAKLPTLAKPGGPPVFEGLSDISRLDPETQFPTTLAVGYVLNGLANYTYYNPATMQTMVQIGKFQSWQCATAKGTFKAIVGLTTLSNGTQTRKTVCMYGEVYLMQQQISWVQSESACPEALPEDGSYHTTTLYSLDRDATFECGEADGDADGYLSSSTDVGGPQGLTSATGPTSGDFGMAPSPAF
ncbi:hypothetical protein ABPG75_002832 [Micractinium tetrahymenae]